VTGSLAVKNRFSLLTPKAVEVGATLRYMQWADTKVRERRVN